MAEPWPADLPQYFLVDSYQESEGDPRIFDEMDVGPPAVRARTSATSRVAAGEMIMTAAQRQDFQVFVRTTLLNGSLTFTMPNQLDEGGTDYLCRFTRDGMPKWSSIGAGLTRVAFSIEILP